MSKPAVPEPKYFLRSKGSLNEYEQLYFQGADPLVKYWGEKSTSYYEFPEVAEKIKRMIPEARVLLVVRNPVARALSNYYFSLQNGLETRSLEDVFLNNVSPPNLFKKVSVNPFNYLGRGEYAGLLQPFKEQFGSNLLIIRLEELELGASEVGSLFNWLGLDSMSNLILTKVNEGRIPQHESREVVEFLRNYYRESIEVFENKFSVDLGSWKKEDTTWDR